MPIPVVTDDRGASGTGGLENPELSHQEEKPVVDGDVFGDAFDKAELEVDGGKADLSAADDPKNLKEGESVQDPEKVPGVQASKEEPDKEEPKPQESVVGDGGKIPAPVAQGAEANAAEQRYKTLQGIHNHDKQAWAEERTALLAQLEAAQKPATLDTKKTKEETNAAAATFEDNLTDEQKAELEAYDADFNMVSKMEGVKRERELKKLKKEISDWKDSILAEINATKESLAPAMQLVKESETEAHFNAIQEGFVRDDGTHVDGHPDYEKYVNDGSLKTWIETKPGYIRRSMERIYNQGSVQDAIDLISDFKRENNIVTQPIADNIVDLAGKRNAKKAALTAVDSRRTAVMASHAVAENYEEAFDEALNKSGG